LKNSNAFTFSHSYVLKWYKAHRLKKSFRGSNFVQKFGPFWKRRHCFYMVPVGIIGYLFLLPYSTTFVCQKMKAPFLLNNSFEPSVNMAELYEMRRKSCNSYGLCNYNGTSDKLWWDYVYWGQKGYRSGNYFPMETIDNLDPVF